jgi:putative nucleotidyltransferase with HDIG domain
MAYTIETRDPYTAGHQRRVTKLASAIAEEMNLSTNQKEGVRLAGGLHDLGKIYVPAEILAKPGKLSPVEYNIIKTHPQVGFDIIKSIEFPWPIAEFILQHHERMDGSGYPNGLKGEEIHLEARILAVADVIEAMATHRPYRAALSIEEALDEITKNQDDKYDKDVVKACLSVFKEKKFAFD